MAYSSEVSSGDAVRAATCLSVIGAAGRMGRFLVRIVAETPAARLVAAVAHAGSAAIGHDAGMIAGLGPVGVLMQAELPSRAAAGDRNVWIDFSSTKAAVANATAAAEVGAAFVLGTTGLSAADTQEITLVAKRTPVVYTANFSVGLNVLLDLVARTARLLGPDYDLEILEAHHRSKRDAPSGTALRLAEALAAATERDIGKTALYARKGNMGPRTREEIGLQTIRGGDVVGDHTVFFLGQGDRIEITHRASSRETFARGAVRAALWLADQPPGLYDMRDVLGLRLADTISAR